MEPTSNTNLVTLHTVVYHFNIANYLDHQIDIQGNTIRFDLCYSNDIYPSPTYDERDFEITLPSGYENFTFEINFYTWDEFGNCDYSNVLDEAVINFSYPYNPVEKTLIPDDNFEHFLETKGFGDGLVGNHFVFTHRFVNIGLLFMNALDLGNLGLQQIESLEGIELLYRLKFLSCQDNLIQSFNATLHPKLARLYISGNPINLIEVYNCPDLYTLSAGGTLIGNVDLTNNSKLRVLHIGSPNFNSIDISHNLDLWEIQLIGTSVQNLDLSSNTALERLVVKENDFLEALNLEGNPNIETLDCQYNTVLEYVLMGQNPLISIITCIHNDGLLSVDVSGCGNLSNFQVFYNPMLTHLDLSQNPLLKDLFIQNDNITSLDLRNGASDGLEVIIGLNNPNLFCVDVSFPNAAPYGQWLFDNEIVYTKDCSLGIQEAEKPNGITVFPNPVAERLYVRTESPILKVEVYDVTGKALVSGQMNDQLDVSNFDTGFYFLKVYMKEEVVTKPFLKR
ncbi:MAG: T9SS type A sorting domain-containing protein [Flavobacteriaceae bacterium]